MYANDLSLNTPSNQLNFLSLMVSQFTTSKKKKTMKEKSNKMSIGKWKKDTGIVDVEMKWCRLRENEKERKAVENYEVSVSWFLPPIQIIANISEVIKTWPLVLKRASTVRDHAMGVEKQLLENMLYKYKNTITRILIIYLCYIFVVESN